MDPREDYKRIQKDKVERGGIDFRFPIAAELANSWEKVDIPLKELMEREDLQLYVGNPGEFSYDIYQQTLTSKANEIGKHWNTIQSYLPNDDVVQKHIQNINKDLANLVVYSREKGEDYPLIIVENKLVLPFTTGSIIDGNHRLISLLYELRNGNLQESTPIPVWVGKIPTALSLPYSIFTMSIDKKPLYQRILLFKERMFRK
jgi:hypothetical protein